MKKHCTECGKELHIQDKFCKECGAKIISEKELNKESINKNNLEKITIPPTEINIKDNNVKSGEYFNSKIFIGVIISFVIILLIIISPNGSETKDELVNEYADKKQTVEPNNIPSPQLSAEESAKKLIEELNSINNYEVENLISSYIYSLKTKNINTLLLCYANEVDYFGAGKVSKEFIWKDKESYYKTWDNVDYWLIKNSMSISDLPNNSKLTGYKIGYSVYSTKRRKLSEGVAESSCKIRRGKNGLEIYDEKQKIISKELKQ